VYRRDCTVSFLGRIKRFSNVLNLLIDLVLLIISIFFSQLVFGEMTMGRLK
jgi:hypothetical protein